MLTLSTLSYQIRTILKWGGIIGGAFFILFILIRFGGALKESLFPTPLPPPTVAFGKLPKINFPQKTIDKKYSYTINTIDGKLPILPDRVYVFTIKKPQQNLLSLNRARETLKTIGFTTDETEISPNVYEWKDNSDISKTISFNIVSRNFKISSDYLMHSDVFTQYPLPTEQEAISTTYSFLTRINSLPIDIDKEKTKTLLLKNENGSLTNATSFSQAQFIRVDLFHKNTQNLSIYYPDKGKSTMNTILAPFFSGGQIVESQFLYQEIASPSATYPILTSEEAFTKLKNNSAYVAGISDNSSVEIIKIGLGYYLGDKPQEYLMPIFVFEGLNNFVAYVSAVKDEWIK